MQREMVKSHENIRQKRYHHNHSLNGFLRPDGKKNKIRRCFDGILIWNEGFQRF